MPSCAGNPVSTREGYHAIKCDAGAVAVKPTVFIRAESGTIEFNKTIEFAKSAQNSRAGNTQALPGQEETTGTINYEFDFNDIVFSLYGVLGGLSTTDVGTGASVYKHVITPDNCLPSFTYEEGIGRTSDTTNNYQNILVKRSYGVIIAKTVIKIESGALMVENTMMAKGQFIEGILTADADSGSSVAIAVDRTKGLTTSDNVNIYDTTPQNEVDAVAAVSLTANTVTIGTLGNSYTIANYAKVELVPQTPSYSINPQIPTAGQTLIRFGEDLTAAASAEAGCIRSCAITIDNDPEAQACIGDFSAAAGGVTPKARTVTMEFTRSFKNKDDMDKYIQTRTFAILIDTTNGKVVNASDTGNLPYRALIKIPKAVINGMPITRDNNGIYEYTCSVTAILDSVTGYDISADVWNSRAASVYNA